MTDATGGKEIAPAIPIHRARFELEMERLRALRKEQPPQRGVDPVQTSPDLVHGVASAAGIWSVKKVAEALGMGKSTVSEWVARARRDGARGLSADPRPWHDDVEVAAIFRCIAALEPLEREARHRVLNYIDERFFGKAKVKP